MYSGSGIWGYKRKEVFRFVEKLGVGINLGNSLDATDLWDYHPEAEELAYEETWNNPPITREQLRLIREAGFRSVRIPVTWEDHLDEEGNVSAVWMNRVQEVVAQALEEGLYVILNTHHEKWMDLKPEKEEEISRKFQRLWTQIAECFSTYDERLLFEGMNEPRLRDSEEEWKGGTSEQRAMVNRLNQLFIDTVRGCGEKNYERYLLITTYGGSMEEEAVEELAVPKGRIIVSLHTYTPYLFCQKEDGTTQWNRENPEDTKEIEEKFRQMKQTFIKKNIPVIITEFGCVDKGNLEDRIAWTEYYRELAEENNISYMWWDNGSTYRLLNRRNNTLEFPEIVEVLVKEK